MLNFQAEFQEAASEESAFIERLAEALSQDPLSEKWLLAPTLRVGFQWLERVSRISAILNARVKTLRGIALEIAAPALAGLGLSYLGRNDAMLLCFSILNTISKRKKQGYFSGIGANRMAASALLSSISDLRMAGIRSCDIERQAFQNKDKASDLSLLFSLYEKELKERGLADYPRALEVAWDMVNEIKKSDAILVTSTDLVSNLRGLEREFLSALSRSVETVMVDEGGKPAQEGQKVEVFKAVGEVNEVNQVLRTAVSRGIPLDQIEILYTDSSYVPLIYEVFSSRFGESDVEQIPVTFEEGIPVSFSRPGMALRAWLSWADGYSQGLLLRMLRDGLIRTEKMDGAVLAEILGRFTLGANKERHVEILGKIPQKVCSGDTSEISGSDVVARITSIVTGLVEKAESSRDSGHSLLASSHRFLKEHARATSMFDEYSKKRLMEEIEAAHAWLEVENIEPQASRDFLLELLSSAKAGGAGPMPGKVYAAPIQDGGHSGRPWTFIIGLDDERFASNLRQDPFLLDEEREEISDDLPTSDTRALVFHESLSRVLGRIRGNAVLSFSMRSLREDSEKFPSEALLEAINDEKADAKRDYTDFENLPVPLTSFAPCELACVASRTEYWLEKIASEGSVLTGELVEKLFPNIGQGKKASRARNSAEFTEYDGYVPEAGKYQNPFDGGITLTASALETLARCPMEYFLSFVLGVKSLDEVESDPTIWLSPQEKGLFLHEIFRDFMRGWSETGFDRSRENCLQIMTDVFKNHVEKAKTKFNPPEAVLRHEIKELWFISKMFVKDQLSLRDVPAYFELVIGSKGVDSECLISTEEPVSIELPEGRIKAGGRIDRVDFIEGKKKRFSIVDYKTGSSGSYAKNDPFMCGMAIQPYLYLRILNERLKCVKPSSRAEMFSYQFFGVRGKQHGERISWNEQELKDGGENLRLLCEMISTGAFPVSFNRSNFNANYRIVYDHAGEAADKMGRKMENSDNWMLKPFAEIRTKKHPFSDSEKRGSEMVD
ncbi:MAG: PD-(D/E)XK nuclease family protein [Actinomycetota bacterium]|nr:PD-(D/E)XK nuclease family protein [Actinomycetota bacterium]